VSNLKSVGLTVLEQLAFNAQEFRGQVTLAMPLFEKIFVGHVRTVPWNTYVKFEVRRFNRFGAVSLTPKNLGGHMTLAMPPFGEIFGGRVRTVVGTRVSNLKSIALTVLELLAFNSHRSAAHTHADRQTDAHTSNEHIISAIHFVHLAEIIMH